MSTIVKKLLLITTFAVLTAGLAGPAFAADEPKKDQPAAEGKKKGGGIPFKGKISAVDKTAMTLSLKGKEEDRVLHITSQTRLNKAGKPATLDDATVGEDVTGQYKKGDGDKLEAVSIFIGPRPEKKKKDETK